MKLKSFSILILVLLQLPAYFAYSVPSPSPQPEASPAGPVKKVITSAVGELGITTKQIITSREVRIVDIIEQSLFVKDPAQRTIIPLTGGEKNFGAEVKAVLDEWIVYLEAKSFSEQTISASEMEKALQAVQHAVRNLPAWKELEPSAVEVREMVERKLIAKKFFVLKSDSSQVPITDAEAQSHFQKNRLRFGNLPFSAFRENIKSFLIREQTGRRVQDWIDVLRRKYKVRNYIST